MITDNHVEPEKGLDIGRQYGSPMNVLAMVAHYPSVDAKAHSQSLIALNNKLKHLGIGLDR